jgi:hypothetical protein
MGEKFQGLRLVTDIRGIGSLIQMSPKSVWSAANFG